ncbi:hypothetical protein Tcan_00172, partial [Toxocara canis]
AALRGRTADSQKKRTSSLDLHQSRGRLFNSLLDDALINEAFTNNNSKKKLCITSRLIKKSKDSKDKMVFPATYTHSICGPQMKQYASVINEFFANYMRMQMKNISAEPSYIRDCEIQSSAIKI